MSNSFWELFNNKKFKAAQQEFIALNKNKQEAILEELFQKSEYHRKPTLISLLSRELKDEKDFNEFYQSWYPAASMCNPLVLGTQMFQQHYPLPVRALNALNIHNPREIMSLGITWARSIEEEKRLWKHLENANIEKDSKDSQRHEQINKIAEGELLGLFRVQTDDNLGTPF